MNRSTFERNPEAEPAIPMVSEISESLSSLADASAPANATGDAELSKGRYRRMATASLAGLAGKGTSLLVSFIIVPITVRYLGPERYGVWIAISSSILMFFWLDIGIANTLTNLISEAYAAADWNLAAKYFATALWMVVGVSSVFALCAWLAWPHIHWETVFRIRGDALVRETSRAFAAALIVLLFALPTNLITRVMAGLQELHVANLFTAGGSVLSLLMVLAVIHVHGSLAMLVTGYAGAMVVANACCLVWVCGVAKPWLRPWPTRVDWSKTSRLLHTGGQFFVLQIAGLIVFNSDNLILAHYLDPIAVTKYSVTWRLVGAASAIQALIIPSLWPAYSESWARGDIRWIRTAYSRMRWATLGVLTMACVVLVPAGRAIIRLWAGPAAVPSAALLYLMCVWMIVLALTTNQACLMGATYRLRMQTISSCTAAAVNLALSIWWVRRLGPEGVILATLVSYVLFILFVQAREVRSILSTTPAEQPA